MYLAIDVGGTKTLLAVFSEEGDLLAKHKILTNPDYVSFLDSIKKTLSSEFGEYNFTYCCCAVPGSVDRKSGVGIRFGNLGWSNVPIKQDLSTVLNGMPVLVEHDAAVGGLSEALLVQDQYRRVLYVAPGTGIGVALILDGKIDSDLADNEAGHMIIEESDNNFYTWEDLASGRALKATYGKLASEIEDPSTWKDFAHKFARGLQPLLATLQPEVTIVGAGVGSQLHKFSAPLEARLKNLENKMVPATPVIQARRAEEAVIYGCYDFIKQNNQ